jgi:PAS domain S-box-containing protein
MGKSYVDGGFEQGLVARFSTDSCDRLLISSVQNPGEKAPAPAPIPQTSPPVAPKRNPRIKLFSSADRHPSRRPFQTDFQRFNAADWSGIAPIVPNVGLDARRNCFANSIGEEALSGNRSGSVRRSIDDSDDPPFLDRNPPDFGSLFRPPSMNPASHSSEELHRLAELQRYQPLESESDLPLEDLASLAAQICGAPIAFITLIGKDRLRYQTSIGLFIKEAPRDGSFCDQVILYKDLFIVPDATADKRFAANPLVAGEEGVRFFAGCPLRTSDGIALGILSVLDRVPRQLTEPQQEGLRKLGRLVMSQLNHRRQARELAASEERLRIVTENARVGLVVLDADRRYVYVNKTHAEIFGRSPASIVGRHAADVHSEIYEDQIRPHLDRAFAGEGDTYEIHTTVTDIDRDFRVILEPMRIDGAVAYVVAVVTDISGSSLFSVGRG